MALKLCIQDTRLTIHCLDSLCHIGNQPLLDGMDMSGGTSHREDHVPGTDGIGVSEFHRLHPVYGLLFNIRDLRTDNCHLGGDVLGFQFYCRRGSVPKGHPQGVGSSHRALSCQNQRLAGIHRDDDSRILSCRLNRVIKPVHVVFHCGNCHDTLLGFQVDVPERVV